jgi:hypothetical protein
MKVKRHIILFLMFYVAMCEQAIGQNTPGKVTFVTSQNVYVKFDHTEDLNIGDTLQLSDKKTPCLVVKNKSSSSCVCETINGCVLQKNDQVSFHHSPPRHKEIIKKNAITDQTNTLQEDASATNPQTEKTSKYKEAIKGRISVSSYSNITNTRDDRHRLMSRLSLDAEHIRNSAFSFETYLNYRQHFVSGQHATPDISDVKIYSLGLKYDITPGLSVILGRKINPKFSSVGAIDGLQVEKTIEKNYIGVVSGFRPDIFDYKFNPNLFQYGAYMGRTTEAKNFFSQTTLGIIEQKNNGQTDRRYAYFQHSSTILKKLNLFSSMELDVYNKVSDTLGNTVRLTNLYMSARYRFTRKFNVSVSYDSRKNIIYYETFQTEIERLLNDDIARQGIRIRINFRPIKYVSAGVSYSKRFQSNMQNKSKNIYGYAGLSKIPGVGGRLSVNYNLNTSNYLQSKAWSFRHSRGLIENKLDLDIYYRHVNYAFLNRERKLVQSSYYGTNFSYYIKRKLMISLSAELSDYNKEKNYIIYGRITQRFDINTRRQ